MDEPPSWPEQVYERSRKRLGWLVPLLVASAGLAIWTLVRSATQHVIYERARGYIRLEDNPVGFWIRVTISSGAFASLLLILVLIFIGYRAALARSRRP